MVRRQIQTHWEVVVHALQLCSLEWESLNVAHSDHVIRCHLRRSYPSTYTAYKHYSMLLHTQSTLQLIIMLIITIQTTLCHVTCNDMSQRLINCKDTGSLRYMSVIINTNKKREQLTECWRSIHSSLRHSQHVTDATNSHTSFCNDER